MGQLAVFEEHTYGTPHQVSTPLENFGTPWHVRYTRLTSTALNCKLETFKKGKEKLAS